MIETLQIIYYKQRYYRYHIIWYGIVEILHIIHITQHSDSPRLTRRERGIMLPCPVGRRRLAARKQIRSFNASSNFKRWEATTLCSALPCPEQLIHSMKRKQLTRSQLPYKQTSLLYPTVLYSTPPYPTLLYPTLPYSTLPYSSRL